jgi:signal transduction histidine kinase
LSDLLHPALRTATHAITTGEWPLHHDPAVLREALVLLADTARCLRAGATPTELAPPLLAAPWTPAARALLDLLRRGVLQAAAGAGDAEGYAECHALLVALERVGDLLQGDAVAAVSGRLSGPAALDLLVEVAHDMRSPIGAILLLVDRVRSGASGPVSEAAARQLGLVYGAAFGLSALAGDVMELAHGGKRLLEGGPVPFTIGDLFGRVYDVLAPVADEKGLTLQLAGSAAVLRAPRRGYRAALERVLLNLVTNACKFTDAGTVRVVVEPVLADGDTADDAAVVRFVVEDSGRGVPPQLAAQLAAPFRPRTGSGAASGGEAFSSAGLGLAICRKLVAAMEGELTSGTSAMGGAAFVCTVRLPVEEPPIL